MHRMLITFRQYCLAFSTVLLIASVSGCHSTKIADIKPGERPAVDTDIGGVWFQVEKLEKRIKNAPSRIYDKELNEYITNLTCKIAGDYCSDIRVYIVDIPYFNASMYPNGMMIVWSGFLLRAQSEDQVASVIGHEIGHYVKQHQLKSMRQAKNLNNLLLGVGMVSYTGSFIGNLAASATFFKFSRDHERESDTFGQERLQQLGYDPKAAAELWVLIKQEADVAPKRSRPLYLSTHPSTEERIKNLGGSDQMQIGPAQPAYLDLINDHYEKWIKREVSKRSYNSSEIVLNRLAHADPNNAIIQFYQAELYRRRNLDDDLEKARQLYKKSIDSGYQNPLIYKKLANLNLKLGSNHQAADNFHKYIEFADPDETEKLIIEKKIRNLQAQ